MKWKVWKEKEAALLFISGLTKKIAPGFPGAFPPLLLSRRTAAEHGYANLPDKTHGQCVRLRRRKIISEPLPPGTWMLSRIDPGR